MDPGEPKFRRRKAERPEEILSAALAVFAEKGFAAAKLDHIASRAGVSKGALYLYFATKEELFAAVIDQAVAPDLRRIAELAAGHPGPFPDLARGFALLAPQVLQRPEVGGVMKMIVGEARNFPALARIWHGRVITPALEALSGAITAGQARGEIRAGDPRLYALGLIGPLLAGLIWRETFVPVGAPPFDLPSLAAQHVETVLRGMMEIAP
ncbi:MAG: TetR/AcrR family transcriptional regulator [Pseudomonadota bacterium]